MSTSEQTESSSTQDELRTLLTSVAFARILQTGWLKVTGSDRVRWLNGMVTNSIQDLRTGGGCYNFILNAQGRIQGDANVYAEPDHLLLETGLAQVPGLLPLLDRFIIMDDVELTDVTEHHHGLLVAGPRAPELLLKLQLLPEPDSTPGLARMRWRSLDLTVVRAYSPLVPRFELWTDALEQLSAEMLSEGAPECSASSLERLRIQEGTPLFGVDIRDRDLPQETGVLRALHFAKGCYLGQEIVERIRSRGNVHRTFSGFYLHGPEPAPGTVLLSEGKPVGELTSVASVQETPSDEMVSLALGYIRRDTLALGKPIQYESGTAHPAPLPFRTDEPPFPRQTSK